MLNFRHKVYFQVWWDLVADPFPFNKCSKAIFYLSSFIFSESVNTFFACTCGAQFSDAMMCGTVHFGVQCKGDIFSV